MRTILFIIVIILFTACGNSVNRGKEIDDEVSRNKISDLSNLISHNINVFELDHFRDPESFYWPAYFWGWNDTITKEIIRIQLTDMNTHGARRVCLHPIPKGFRPLQEHLMEPDYMTPEYLKLWAYAAEQCKELDMKGYLYDEGGWPSGSCLGEVVRQNPNLVQQKLIRHILTPDNGSKIFIPDSCISAFLYKGDTRVGLLLPGEATSIDFDEARIMVFSIERKGSYPDLLNPESTRAFLELTHEKYKQAAGSYFGKTIQMTFTDEAQAANPGWTDDIVQDFENRFGYNLGDELPSIFEGENEHDKKVRIDYFNWWSQRHADSYYGVIQEWCHNNNLLSSGHLNGEDATEFAVRYEISCC